MPVVRAIAESQIDHQAVTLDITIADDGQKLGRLWGPFGLGLNELKGILTDWMPIAEAIKRASWIALTLRVDINVVHDSERRFAH
jgi:hypothetical protein